MTEFDTGVLSASRLLEHTGARYCNHCGCQGLEITKVDIHVCSAMIDLHLSCVGCHVYRIHSYLHMTEPVHVWGDEVTLREVNKIRHRHDIEAIEHSDLERKNFIMDSFS